MKLLAFFILVLAGCSSVYETKYTYTPPKSSNGEICIKDCHAVRLKCYQFIEDEYKKNINNENFKDDKEYIKFCENERTINIESCDTEYQACYELCGGKVEKEINCIANCR